MPAALRSCSRSSASFSKRRTRTEAPSSTSASGTPSMRAPDVDRMAVRAGLRVADRGEHALLEHGRHRVLEPLGLLVHLVPRDAEDVGEEALDQPVAADDALGVLAAVVGELQRLVGGSRDVAVALEAADHLVHGRRGELHGPRDVGARHRQPGLVQPEEGLEVLLLGVGRVSLAMRGLYASFTRARRPRAPVETPLGASSRAWPSPSTPGPAAARAVGQGAAEGDGWVYEPKWDGFRAIAFVDGDEVYLQSRNGRPLTRYFPELRFPAGRYVLDGEIVIFDEERRAGLRRARPAHPPRQVADRHARRADAGALHRLRRARATTTTCCSSCRPRERRRPPRGRASTPRSTSRRPPRTPGEAERRGCTAPRASSPSAPTRRYRPGERVGMVKIKRVRTIDAVVLGWRPGKEEGTRRLAHPRPLRRGRASCARSATRPASRPRRSASCPPGSSRTRPASAARGEPSRWASERELEWIELRPELVVEVDLRPHERRAHPPRGEDPALARGQAAARVPHRPALAVVAAPPAGEYRSP